MNRTSSSEITQKFLVLLLALAVPALAWGQHKPSGGGGGSHPAPAAHSSGGGGHAAAARPSGGGQSHAAARPSTQSHAAPSHAAGSQSHAAPSHASGTQSHAAPSHASGTQSHAAPSHAAGSQSHAPPSHAAGTQSHAAAAGGTHAAAPGGTHAAGGNKGAVPGGTHAAGGTHGAAPGGARAGHAGTPAGTRNVSLKKGGSASLRKNGSVRSIDRGGTHIERGVHGGRTVVSERNGARIVSHGRGGYVQRAYVTRGGRAYYSRTFFYGGRYHVGLYRGYGWGGHMYYGFFPGVWYHPGFYGWGWQPWGAPIYWGVGLWGWGGAPWWGFYGGWWNPYPVYAAPYFWLTDYLLAESLQAAYAARQEANADAAAADAAASAGDGGGDAASAASAGVTLTPEVKEAIAQEVKAQLAAQQAQAATQGGAAASGGGAPAPTNASNDTPPPALDPAQRTFVVDSGVTVVANGQECGLTAGDVVTRLTDTPDADQTVNASVSATKKGDCPSGATVAVKVDDLQEMYNHFQEQLTNGMGELAKKQGTNGMPAAPDTGTQASAVPPPAPDTSVAKTLQDQQAQADQTEADVKAEAAAGGGH